MLISTQPYLKSYLFPLFSLGTLIKITLLVTAISLPFFLTYSTPNFYLTKKLQIHDQIINYNYNYHFTINTNQGSFVYTNLYSSVNTNPPVITQMEDQKVLKVGVRWHKQPDYVVKSVTANLLFDFNLNAVNYFGSASANTQGFNLAEVSIAGHLLTVQGEGANNISASTLAQVNFDMIQFANKAQASTAYLQYDYSVLPINMPSDVLEIEMVLNYNKLTPYMATPSIMGQLVWSWVQYFPIFLTLYWLLDKVFAFLVRQKIIKRKLIHDGQYVKLVSSEQNKRDKLHLN